MPTPPKIMIAPLLWIASIPILLVLCFSPRPVHAGTMTVMNLGDGVANPANCPGSGCRLRDAIEAAASGDTVDFAVTGTITLNSGHLIIPEYKTLTITGPSGGPLTINGNNADYILFVDYYATLTLSRVTLTNGGNHCCGGAIRNCAVLYLDQVTISNNSVHFNNCLGCGGGGIYNEFGATLFITNSTISGNQALGVNNTGGGILNWSVLSLNNVTLANNFAADGGGLYSNSGSTSNVQNTLIANNTSGGSGRDCSGAGTFNSQRYNLIGDTTGCTMTGTTTGNVTNVNAMLGGLANYGGVTKTQALFLGSPAIDAGNSATCAPVDQRGVLRTLGSSCDIGAFEGTWYPYYFPLLFR